MKNRIHRDEPQEHHVNWVGQVKVGIKNDKGFPMSLDYFRPDSTVKKYEEEFKKAYGEKPSSIEITFATNDIEEIFIEQYEIRTSKKIDGVGGRLFAKGDGKIFIVWNMQKQTREVRTIEKEPDLMRKVQLECGGVWKATLVLYFIPLRIKGLFAPWKLTTRGEASSIKAIISELDRWHGVLNGKISGVPFDLVVKKVTSDTPGSKNSYPVITLHCNISPGNVDLVKNYLNSNKGFQLLTDDKIKELSNNQIEYIPANDSKQFKDAEKILRNCKSIKELNQMAIEISKENFSEEEKEKLRIIYSEVIGVFK